MGGVTLGSFSLVGVPPVGLGNPWFGVETLGYYQFELVGTLSFVGIPLVCWGTLGLVVFPQFCGVLSVCWGYSRFGLGILSLMEVPLVCLG